MEQIYPINLRPSKYVVGNDELLFPILIWASSVPVIVSFYIDQDLYPSEFFLLILFSAAYLYFAYRMRKFLLKKKSERISIFETHISVFNDQQEKKFNFDKFLYAKKSFPLIGGPSLHFQDDGKLFYRNQYIDFSRLLQELNLRKRSLSEDRYFQKALAWQIRWDQNLQEFEKRYEGFSGKKIVMLSIWGLVCGLIGNALEHAWVTPENIGIPRLIIKASSLLFVAYYTYLMTRVSSLLVFQYLGEKSLPDIEKANLYICLGIPFILGPVFSYSIYSSPRILSPANIPAQALPPDHDYSKVLGDAIQDEYSKYFSEGAARVSLFESIRISRAQNAIVRLNVETDSSGTITNSFIEKKSNFELLDEIGLKIMSVGRKLPPPPEAMIKNGRAKFNWDFIYGDPPNKDAKKID